MGKIYSRAEQLQLAKIIIEVTGGERRASLALVKECVLHPNDFKGKTMEEKKAVIFPLAEEIRSRQSKIGV